MLGAKNASKSVDNTEGCTTMIRVYLIDDHELVRSGFRMLLHSCTDINVVGEADNGEQALAELRKLDVDVILCDLHLPGISGLEVTDRLLRSQSKARVLMVSSQEDGPLPRRLLAAGATGYLAKSASADELITAIRDTANGKRHISATIAQQIALESLTPSHQSPFELLSVREMEVAMLLVQGLRMTAIAQRLNLSAKTIATHKYNLCAKLHVADIASLTRLAIQHGVIEG